MGFEVTADAYDRFMGRFSEPLAQQVADLLAPLPGQRALDVGCGPGALTAVLARRLGAGAVTAVDPSASFVAALHARLPGVDVRRGSAEALPFPDDCFDLAAAQLVVHFMHDPVAGLCEMGRVVREGGAVLAAVWDHAGGAGPLSAFWRAVRDLDPAAAGEAELPGTRQGHLAELAATAGLRDVVATSLTVAAGFATFEDWWDPYTTGVGPAGEHVSGLGERARAALRDHCAELLPDPPFTVEATAWCVLARARAGGGRA